jgi:hypothetical protein
LKGIKNDYNRKLYSYVYTCSDRSGILQKQVFYQGRELLHCVSVAFISCGNSRHFADRGVQQVSFPSRLTDHSRIAGLLPDAASYLGARSLSGL